MDIESKLKSARKESTKNKKFQVSSCKYEEGICTVTVDNDKGQQWNKWFNEYSKKYKFRKIKYTQLYTYELDMTEFKMRRNIWKKIEKQNDLQLCRWKKEKKEEEMEKKNENKFIITVDYEEWVRIHKQRDKIYYGESYIKADLLEPKNGLDS